MATQQTRVLGKLAVAPSVVVLFLWMIVPLGLTIYFSLLRYNLLDPGNESFIGILNYQYFLSDPTFFAAIGNSLKLVFAVLPISIIGGTLLALLLDFSYIVLPHLARPITVVILIETIFLLDVFAEIYVTGTAGPAGNLPYLVYFQGLLNFDVGGASAGGIVAVVLANIVAFFLIRMIGRNLEA